MKILDKTLECRETFRDQGVARSSTALEFMWRHLRAVPNDRWQKPNEEEHHHALRVESYEYIAGRIRPVI